MPVPQRASQSCRVRLVALTLGGPVTGNVLDPAVDGQAAMKRALARRGAQAAGPHVQAHRACLGQPAGGGIPAARRAGTAGRRRAHCGDWRRCAPGGRWCRARNCASRTSRPSARSTCSPRPRRRPRPTPTGSPGTWWTTASSVRCSNSEAGSPTSWGIGTAAARGREKQPRVGVSLPGSERLQAARGTRRTTARRRDGRRSGHLPATVVGSAIAIIPEPRPPPEAVVREKRQRCPR